jgi:hypothetical protein
MKFINSKIKIIFCFNQVSYIIAKKINNDDGIKIIFYSNRISLNKKQNYTFEYLYNNFYGACILFLLSFKNIEIILPHIKTYKLVKLISYFSNNISLIDDGLDTFRIKPKNLCQNLLAKAKNFYTFKYNIPIANWTTQLNIIPVINTFELLNDERALFKRCNTYLNLVIDSPGLNIKDFTDPNSKSYIFFHPNKDKTSDISLKEYKNEFSNLSIEKTLMVFKNNVHLGATFILIFLIDNKIKNNSIYVYLKLDDYINIPIFATNSNLFVSLKKVDEIN